MIGRWGTRLFRLRQLIRRREWLARILGTSGRHTTGTGPGLVLVQIDGLSRRELERSLQQGRLPFLRQLLERERYRLHTMYSGQPSTTPAFQAEFFYGVPSAVPAFAFRSDRTGQIVQSTAASPAVGIQKVHQSGPQPKALQQRFHLVILVFRLFRGAGGDIPAWHAAGATGAPSGPRSAESRRAASFAAL